MVDPASIDGGQTVVESDALLGEKTGQDLSSMCWRQSVKLMGFVKTYVANNASDTVSSEDIETVVISENTLELGCEIANGSGNNTEDERRGSANVAGGRGDSNETANGTRAEADSGPFPLEPIGRMRSRP